MSDEIKHLTKGLENISKQLRGGSHDGYPGLARELIYQQHKVRLFRYCSSAVRQNCGAVMIVYALVNRPHILDINPDHSFIKELIDQGLTVYLVDWGYPDSRDTHNDIDCYISGYLDACVGAVQDDLNQDKVNIVGVCQGGTLSLCYTAMFQHKVNSLTLMVTPVDFEAGDNLLTRWVKYVDIDELVDVLGNIPGPYLDIALQSLKPLTNSMNKYLKFVSSMSDDSSSAKSMYDFSLMERWLLDRPDQPAEFMRQFVKDFYQGNKLIKGTLFIGEKRINLNEINVPLHNIYATRDHIVPRQSSQSLGELVSSKEYAASAVETGHIGIFVSTSALKTTPKLLANWIIKKT